MAAKTVDLKMPGIRLVVLPYFLSVSRVKVEGYDPIIYLTCSNYCPHTEWGFGLSGNFQYALLVEVSYLGVFYSEFVVFV